MQAGGSHDMAVASAGADDGDAITISCFYSGICTLRSTLASALLCVVATGCFNPNLIGHPLPEDNHVPVVEVLPTPTLNPLDAVVEIDQQGCAPLEFEITKLEDADGDTLTVRYDIVVQRPGSAAEFRQRLKSTPPITVSDDGTYPLPNNTGLELNFNTLNTPLGSNLDDQIVADAEVFQLIELRVSDNGFVDDDLGPPRAPAGDGMFFISWNVKVSPCIGTAP